MSKEFKICESEGCENKVYKRHNSNLYSSKYCPNCQLKTATKKSKDPKVNKKAKTKRQNIDKQLDESWSYLVKLLAGHKCEKCQSSKYLNSHHIFSRSNKSVRWNIDNGVCLCAGDHALKTNSAHKDPLSFAEWIKNKRGVQWYDKLTLMAHSSVKYTLFEKQTLLNHLHSEIKKHE